MNSKKLWIVLFLIPVFTFKAMGQEKGKKDIPRIHLLMQTSMGDMKVELYNETPLHRDNFLKLVKMHYFDGMLFHRVIQMFMIQGGDPDSKLALPGELLGNGGPGYTVPAEINQGVFHKKGALAAARESDLENPSMASSGSQFYIVQGKIYPDSILKLQQVKITRRTLFNHLVNLPENAKYLDDYKRYLKDGKVDSIKYVNDFFEAKVDNELPKAEQYTFSPEQIQAYTRIGGTPMLDNTYTVFGEIYEGLEIIAIIAQQKTDKNARPLQDIRIINISIIP